EFVNTVAETFNIPAEEFQLLKSFIEDSIDSVPNNPNILVINNKEKEKSKFSKHIYNENVNPGIRILQISSVSMYALRIFGKQELQLNGQSISSERVHIFTPGSSIRSSKVKPVYYSDV